MNFTEHLIDEAIEWSRSYPTLAKAWAACPRGDWLLWYAARRGTDRRLLVTAACACARTVLHFVPAGEDRPRRAIETAEAWAHGKVPLKKVVDIYAAARRARAAAYAAAYRASCAAVSDDPDVRRRAAHTAASRVATDAAYAAAYALVYAAYAATEDATATDDAAYAAGLAARSATDATTESDASGQLADLVRSIIPAP